MQFFDEDLERFRHAGLENVLVLYYRLVRLGSATDVVRLNSEHFLEVVRSSVGLQSPYLHLTKTLAAELGLASEGLLANQRIRPRRTGVNLVFDQVIQLHHVDIPYCYRSVERLTGSAIIQDDLAYNR